MFFRNAMSMVLKDMSKKYGIIDNAIPQFRFLDIGYVGHWQLTKTFGLGIVQFGSLRCFVLAHADVLQEDLRIISFWQTSRLEVLGLLCRKRRVAILGCFPVILTTDSISSGIIYSPMAWDPHLFICRWVTIRSHSLIERSISFS